MGSVMQYSLGLATGGFLSNLGKVGHAVQGFVASMASVSAISEGVFGQIEHGAWLERLSRRTGEGVAALYGLEKGFKATGLSAEELPQIILQMQKAIGGFNEMGEPTKDIFHGLGLSVEDLKSKNVAEQVKEITEALGKLGKEEAATASGKVFGRMGAGDMLQLARSGKEFGDALEHAQKQGALFARNAKAFNQIEISLMAFKGRVNSLFAGIAEGAAPGIQKILDMLTKTDLSGIGQSIGKTITLLEMSFKSGTLTDTISTALEAGFEKAVNFLGRVLQSTFAALPGLMEAMVSSASAGVEGMKANIYDLLGTAHQMASEMGSNPESAAADNERAVDFFGRADNARKAWKDKVGEAMKQFAGGVAKGIEENTTDVLGNEKWDRWQRLLAIVPLKLEEQAKQATGGLEAGKDKTKVFRGKHPADDALTRIGFFSHSGGTDDYARQTAQNTKKMVDIYQAVAKFMFRNQGSGLTDTNMANV